MVNPHHAAGTVERRDKNMAVPPGKDAQSTVGKSGEPRRGAITTAGLILTWDDAVRIGEEFAASLDAVALVYDEFQQIQQRHIINRPTAYFRAMLARKLVGGKFEAKLSTPIVEPPFPAPPASEGAQRALPWREAWSIAQDEGATPLQAVMAYLTLAERIEYGKPVRLPAFDFRDIVRRKVRDAKRKPAKDGREMT